MKIAKILVLTTYLMIGGGVLFAQNPVERITDYYKNNNRDSALLLIEEYEPEYESHKQWDSLVAVKRLKAVIYSTIKPLPEALEAFTTAEELAEKHLQPTDREYIMVKLNKGDCFSRMSRYDEAIKYFEDVVELATKTRDTTGIKIRALDLQSWVLLDQRKFQEALELAKQVKKEILAKNPPDTALLIGNFGTLGNIYSYLSVSDSALYYKEKWLECVKYFYPPDHSNLGFAYTGMSDYFFDLKEMDQALKYLNRAEDVFYQNYLKYGNTRYLSVAIANKGMVYYELGEYQLATEYYEKAISLLENEYGRYNRFMMEFYLILSDIKMQTGQLNSAKIWLERVDSVLLTNPGLENEMIMYTETYDLRYYLLTGQMDKSQILSNALYDYYKSRGLLYSHEGLNITVRLAQLHRRNKDFEKALSWLRQNLVINDSIFTTSTSSAIETLNDIMEIQMTLGNFDNVEELGKEILRRRNNGNNELNIRFCLPSYDLLIFANNWAHYLRQGVIDNRFSKDRYVRFIHDFESYYNQHLSIIRSNSTISNNAEIIKEIYQPGIELFAEEDPEQAIIYSEKIKSFLTRIILQSQLIQADSKAKDLQTKVNELIARSIEDNSQSVFVEAGRVLEEFNSYKDSLYRSNRILYNKTYGFPDIEIEDILNTLEKGEMLLEYTALDSVMYIMGMSRNFSVVNKIDLVDVDSLLYACKNGLNREALQQLYLLLIPEKVRHYTSFFIVPDWKLFHFNFEQLVDETEQYLLATKNFRYAYSSAVYNYQSQLAEQKNNTRNIIALTPGFTEDLKDTYLQSLPGGNVDSAWLYFLQQPFLLKLAESLNRINESQSLTTSNAHELSFKSHTGGFKIIHLGTHGIIDDHSPLFSKLIFAKDSLEDGYLHTYEIFGQNLDANLAVLSACETGIGDYTSGEGVVSLAHAFTHAGCPSVLMSLWKIDEQSSAEIIDKFYSYLIQGESKSSALRKAKLDFLAASPNEMKAPYYWAGLVIMGDDSPIQFASRNQWIWWCIGACVVLLIVFFRKFIISNASKT